MPLTITGGKIYRYLTCRRLPFMDAHADPADAVEQIYRLVFESTDDPGSFDEKEAARAARRAAANAKRNPGTVVIADAATATAAAGETLSAMRSGAREIANGLLGVDRWWGKPGLLVRSDGPSRFGSWHYRTRDELMSKNQSIKRIAILNAFYAELLGNLQGVRLFSFDLRRRMSRAYERVELEPYERDLRTAVDAVRASLDDRSDPGPDIRTSVCERCRWSRACDRDARESNSLTLLSGGRRESEEHFRAHGIRTLPELWTHPDAAAITGDAPYLRRQPDRALAQARAFATGQSLLVGNSQLPPRSACEIFVDFETEGGDNRRDGTVFGIVIRRRKPRIRVHIAARSSDRRRAWRAFLKDIESTPSEAPIFHYGAFDRGVMEGMLAAYGGSSRVLRRMVDVYPEVKQRAAIPEPSLSLKVLAKSIGVERRHDLRGLDAPALWHRYASTRDPTLRRRLREYNEDDLSCLLSVTDWLRGIGSERA